MATKLHAAQTLRGMRRNSLTVVEQTATTAAFNSTYSPCSIKVPSGKIIATKTFGPVTSYHFRGHCYSNGTQNNSSGSPWIELRNSSNVPVFRIAYSSLGNIQAQYWNGSAWVNTGSAFLCPWWSTGMSLKKVDLSVVCGASGSWALTLNDTATASGSIASASTDNIARAVPGALAINDTHWSHIMGADYDISADLLMFSELNADSTANAGQASGSYTDLKELPIDDSTKMSIAHGNRGGVKHTGIVRPDGYKIAAWCAAARMRRHGTAADGKLGLRSNTTNSAGSANALVGGYDVVNEIRETNPDAGHSAWTQTAFNASEPYAEAA